MLDINAIRENPDYFRKDLKKRKMPEDNLDKVISVDKKWRELLLDVDKLKHEKNVSSKKVAELKKEKKSAEKEIANMQALKEKLEKKDVEAKKLLEQRDSLLLRLPLPLHESVPLGKDASENVELRAWGKAEKKSVENHGELMEKKGFIDFDHAVEASGSGFVYLKGPLALLDKALERYALDFLLDKGFEYVFPPAMLRQKVIAGAIDISEFDEAIYKIENEDLHLIGTAEHPLLALHMNDVIPEEELPKKYVGYSTNFRKEIGSHGLDEKGLFRMHQFNKVEQVVFARPDNSWELLEELTKNAEDMLKELGIPHHVIVLCTGDMNNKAAKIYDLEYWSPRTGGYKELGSSSNCLDYQTRRLNMKFGKHGGEKSYLHALNCTAIATSRTMIAILENHQEDGVIKVPKVLHKYMHGITEF